MEFSDDYDLVTRDGQLAADSTRVATVFLYPNSRRVRDDWLGDGGTGRSVGAVVEGLENGLGTLLSRNAIEFYEVYEYTASYPNLRDYSRSQYRADFRPWLDETVADGYFPDMTGCHYGVAGGFDDAGGYAPMDGSASSTAFVTSNAMLLGTGSANPDKIRSFAIQETLHTFISYDVAVDNGLARPGSSTHEHDMGLIDEDGGVTPLATTWTACSDYPRASDDNHANHGEGLSDGCWSTHDCSGGSYSQRLSDCTIAAVEYTADAALGDH